MKRLIGAVLAVALVVSVAPVLAGDSFYALSRLPAGLSPLDNAQLATIEGGQNIDVCVDCTNLAQVYQWQEAFQSSYVSRNFVYYGDIEVEQKIQQKQEAEVNQSIN